MVRSNQGVRSSRTRPTVLLRDRRRLRKLDRAISLLDSWIRINTIVNAALATKQMARRQLLDDRRKSLRHRMKGVEDGA